MMDSFWADLTTAEQALAALPGAMGVAASDPNFTHARQNVSNTVNNAVSQWGNFKANLAAVATGLGFFILGSLMLAFSFGEDLASIAERVARTLPAPEA